MMHVLIYHLSVDSACGNHPSVDESCDDLSLQS